MEDISVTCPRCSHSFTCRSGQVEDCACGSLGLSGKARQRAARFEGCLCVECLRELEGDGNTRFHEFGFEIFRKVFQPEEIIALTDEVDRLAFEAGSASVRRVIEKSDRLKQLCSDSRLQALLPDLMLPVRSMVFDKTVEQNWPVLWHQDLTIAVKCKKEISGYGPWSKKEGVTHVQPPSALLERMATLRIHLDDTSEENGALQVIPSSHTLGRIPHKEVKQHLKNPMTCTCRPGDVLLMSPLILHASKKSIAPQHRRIIHFEYAPAEGLHPELAWHEQV